MMTRHNVSTWIGYEPPPFEDMLELASSCHIYLKFVNLDVQIREASARIPKGISYLKLQQICPKSRRISCVIPCCKLQCGITQPILRLL